MSNNNALTGMTGGLTRPHTPQSIGLDSGVPLPKRQAPAVLAPSVKVSLSDDVIGEQSKGQRLTEKFEQSSRELLSHQQADDQENGKRIDGELIDGDTGAVILTPLELPSKKDLEAFEDLFTKELAKAGIDNSIPIKLKSNSEGGVQVTNDHPDKEKIEALFEGNRGLQQGFVKAETYTTLQKIYQLHQQWMQNVESGMSEESAGNWLVNASNNAVDNSELTFTKSKVAPEAFAKKWLS
jgi:hypothetical protein